MLVAAHAFTCVATYRPLPTAPSSQPLPPTVKNCADFASYAEAKAWFDRYYPQFGDVAKLDGNGDGIPCEKLMARDGR